MVLTKQEAELRKLLNTAAGAISVVSPRRVLVGPYAIDLLHQTGRIQVAYQVGAVVQQVQLLTPWIRDGWERISNALIDANLPPDETVDVAELLEPVGAS